MNDWKSASPSTDAWSEYERLRETLVTLRRSLEEVSETAYSPDGLVGATVGARGELIELTLDPRIYRTTDSTALAATIIATVREAVSAATARTFELTKPFLPEGMQLEHGPDGADGADRIFDSVLRRFDR
jgi:DNA-binding protein YbaB